MRIAGIPLPFRFLKKPEVWVITLDLEDNGDVSLAGFAVKAYMSEAEAHRERRLAENLMLGCRTYLIQNSDKSTRFQLLEREQVWLDLCELLPKAFGPEGHVTVTTTLRPILAVSKLDLK